MRHSIILAIFAALFASCSKQGLEPDSAFASTIEIQNKSFQLNYPIGFNDNCGFLNTTLYETNTNNFPYILDFKLSTQGEIVKVDLADGRNNFRSPLFNPKEFVKITEFKYDSLSKTLSFNFDGKLIVPNDDETITIKGSINTNDVSSTRCEAPLAKLEGPLELASGERKRFFSAIATGERDDVSDRQYFYSNDGLRIVLESKTRFGKMAKGIYPVSSASSPIKVTFERYLGLSDKNNFYKYVESEWQKYRVDGTLEVTQNKANANGISYIMGKLSLRGFNETNQVVYRLSEGNIVIVSFP